MLECSNVRPDKNENLHSKRFFFKEKQHTTSRNRESQSSHPNAECFGMRHGNRRPLDPSGRCALMQSRTTLNGRASMDTIKTRYYRIRMLRVGILFFFSEPSSTSFVYWSTRCYQNSYVSEMHNLSSFRM